MTSRRHVAVIPGHGTVGMLRRRRGARRIANADVPLWRGLPAAQSVVRLRHYEFLTAVKGRRVLVERASAERLVDSYLVGSLVASGMWERRRISGGMV